jgi:hypothetical protein
VEQECCDAEEKDEDGCEMLEMLCDAVEVDDYIASKQKELNVMNTIMD